MDLRASEVTKWPCIWASHLLLMCVSGHLQAESRHVHMSSSCQKNERVSVPILVTQRQHLASPVLFLNTFTLFDI